MPSKNLNYADSIICLKSKITLMMCKSNIWLNINTFNNIDRLFMHNAL